MSDLPFMKNLLKSRELGWVNENYHFNYLKRLIDNKKEHVFLVAEKSSKIIGAVYGECNKKENWAELVGIGVLKDYRGQGIGSKLIREFEKIIKSKGIDHIELFAHVDTLAKHIHKLGYEKGETYVNCMKKLK